MKTHIIQIALLAVGSLMSSKADITYPVGIDWILYMSIKIKYYIICPHYPLK